MKKVGTLIWDDEDGEGFIKFEKSWINGATLDKLDATVDWLDFLAESYNNDVDDWTLRKPTKTKARSTSKNIKKPNSIVSDILTRKIKGM